MTGPEPQQTMRRSRGPKRSEETHRAVLEAAERLLTEKGPAAVTFEAVAREAGAGKPTLYRWWRNRTALLLEIYARRKQGCLAAVDTGDLRTDLFETLSALWRFWRDTPAGRAYAAVIAEAQSDDDARTSLADQFADPNFSLTPIFDRALTRGEVATPDEAMALREFVVALNWLRLLTDRLDTDDLPALLDALLRARPASKRGSAE